MSAPTPFTFSRDPSQYGGVFGTKQNFIINGDFRDSLATGVNFNTSDTVGAWMGWQNPTLIAGDSRGAYAGFIYDRPTWAGSGAPDFPDLNIQGALAVYMTSANTISEAHLAAGDIVGAEFSTAITNGVRMFSEATAKVTFWAFSTSRFIGLRLKRHFGTGSITPDSLVGDRLINLIPNQWCKVEADFAVPALSGTEDIEPGDFLLLSVVFDSVTGINKETNPLFSQNLFLYESAATGGGNYFDSPLTAVAGFTMERLGGRANDYSASPVGTGGGATAGVSSPSDTPATFTVISGAPSAASVNLATASLFKDLNSTNSNAPVYNLASTVAGQTAEVWIYGGDAVAATPVWNYSGTIEYAYGAPPTVDIGKWGKFTFTNLNGSTLFCEFVKKVPSPSVNADGAHGEVSLDAAISSVFTVSAEGHNAASPTFQLLNLADGQTIKIFTDSFLSAVPYSFDGETVVNNITMYAPTVSDLLEVTRTSEGLFVVITALST